MFSLLCDSIDCESSLISDKSLIMLLLLGKFIAPSMPVSPCVRLLSNYSFMVSRMSILLLMESSSVSSASLIWFNPIPSVLLLSTASLLLLEEPPDLRELVAECTEMALELAMLFLELSLRFFLEFLDPVPFLEVFYPFSPGLPSSMLSNGTLWSLDLLPWTDLSRLRGRLLTKNCWLRLELLNMS